MVRSDENIGQMNFAYEERGKLLIPPKGLTLEQPFAFLRCQADDGSLAYAFQTDREFEWASLLPAWEKMADRLRIGPYRDYLTHRPDHL